MSKFKLTFKTKWADFDPNRHMRHTAYSDYAAEIRVRFFQQHHLSMNDFARLQIGPVIFKEQTSYFKEIHIGEDIEVDMELIRATKDLDRWEFIHHIFNKNGDLSAEVKVFGAWIDLKKRKLTKLPAEILSILQDLPKSNQFELISNKK